MFLVFILIFDSISIVFYHFLPLLSICNIFVIICFLGRDLGAIFIFIFIFIFICIFFLSSYKIKGEL